MHRFKKSFAPWFTSKEIQNYNFFLNSLNNQILNRTNVLQEHSGIHSLTLKFKIMSSSQPVILPYFTDSSKKYPLPQSKKTWYLFHILLNLGFFKFENFILFNLRWFKKNLVKYYKFLTSLTSNNCFNDRFCVSLMLSLNWNIFPISFGALNAILKTTFGILFVSFCFVVVSVSFYWWIC